MDTSKGKRPAILRVSGATNVTSLRTATIGYLKDGNIVYLDCIGVAANYVATKTIIVTQAFARTMGLNLMFTPIYQDFEIAQPNDEVTIKTGIRWILMLND